MCAIASNTGASTSIGKEYNVKSEPLHRAYLCATHSACVPRRTNRNRLLVRDERTYRRKLKTGKIMALPCRREFHLKHSVWLLLLLSEYAHTATDADPLLLLPPPRMRSSVGSERENHIIIITNNNNNNIGPTTSAVFLLDHYCSQLILIYCSALLNAVATRMRTTTNTLSEREWGEQQKTT